MLVVEAGLLAAEAQWLAVKGHWREVYARAFDVFSPIHLALRPA